MRVRKRFMAGLAVAALALVAVVVWASSTCSCDEAKEPQRHDVKVDLAAVPALVLEKVRRFAPGLEFNQAWTFDAGAGNTGYVLRGRAGSSESRDIMIVVEDQEPDPELLQPVGKGPDSPTDR